MSDIQKTIFRYFCLALIGIHGIWICIHMYYHSQDYLNPWKLGGYAMYTMPSPLYWVLAESATRPDNLPKIRYNHFNYYARGGCLSGVATNFYDSIIDEDVLYGNFDPKEPIKLTFHIEKFSFEKREHEDQKIGHALITTKPNGIRQIKEYFCNKERVIYHESK